MIISRMVHGVGINDCGYQVHKTERVNGSKKTIWLCHFYRTWKGMLKRCYYDRYHQLYPTYAGCTVTPDWHYFSAFREWMNMQNWNGNQLDKDILAPGNSVYGPDSCVFVSRALNAFMTDHGSLRGEWPIGVHADRRSGMFIAQCSNPFSGKRERLGVFARPQDAHEAWRERKHELSRTYAGMQTDPRVAAALLSRYSPETSTQPE